MHVFAFLIVTLNHHFCDATVPIVRVNQSNMEVTYYAYLTPGFFVFTSGKPVTVGVTMYVLSISSISEVMMVKRARNSNSEAENSVSMMMIPRSHILVECAGDVSAPANCWRRAFDTPAIDYRKDIKAFVPSAVQSQMS